MYKRNSVYQCMLAVWENASHLLYMAYLFVSLICTISYIRHTCRVLPQQAYTLSEYKRIFSKFITYYLYHSGRVFHSSFSEPFRDNKTNMITCFSYDLIKVKKKLVTFLLLIFKTLGFVGWFSNLVLGICIYLYLCSKQYYLK